MKVLKDNYKGNRVKHIEEYVKPYPRKLICENCESELEYEESDMRMGVYGCMFLDCPLCRYDNMLEDNEKNIKLTVDNIEFPVHYHHTSVETGAKDCCNNEKIRSCLREAIDYFRRHKHDEEEPYNWWTQRGNLYINVHRYSEDEEYSVIISNDFYSMEISFEAEDY